MSAEPQVPAAGEEIHLPGPSAQPLLVAVGVTIALLGVTTNIILVIAGTLLTLVTIVRWALDTRREIEELPAEHHH